MILLRKNQANKIVVTLSELANPSLPNNWLFVFQKEQSKGEYTYKIQLTDVSVNTDRYNEFSLTLPTDLDIPKVGDYMYSVYQMPDELSTDETEGELVERGKMRLKDAETVVPTFEADTNTPIYAAQ